MDQPFYVPHFIVRKNLVSLVTKWVNKGWSVNYQDAQGNCALMIAIEKNFIYVLTELLRAPDIDVNLANDRKVTPLDFAVFLRRIEMVEMLLNKGANVSFRDDEGRTSLHTAAFWCSDAEVTSMLVAKDPRACYIRNNEGKTPLDVAQKEHNFNVSYVITKTVKEFFVYARMLTSGIEDVRVRRYCPRL